VIEYTRATPRTSDLIDDPLGRDNCSRFPSPLAIKDGYWSTKPLRRAAIEEHLGRAWRAENLARAAAQPQVLAFDRGERIDVTTRYKLVSFTDPEETFLLPESIETLEMFAASCSRIGTRQEFSTFADSCRRARVK